MGNVLLHIIIMTCITSFPVLGYNVVFGKGKILHFGQQAQSLVAVYTMWVLTTQYNQPFLLSLFACIVLTAAVSLVLAWLSLRLEPDGLGVMSIALHLTMLAVILNWQSVTRGALGIAGISRSPFPDTMFGYAVMMVVAAALWIWYLKWLDGRAFGRKLAALSEHNWHAESLGISRRNMYISAFLISGVGSILASVFFPPYQSLLSPSDYNFPVMIFFVMCVVAGGPGKVWGVMMALMSLMFLKEGLRFVDIPPHLLGPIRLILFGVILYVAVWIRRDKVFPAQRSI